MGIQNDLNHIKMELKSLKAANEEYRIYVVVVDENGKESEPELLLSTKLGVIK